MARDAGQPKDCARHRAPASKPVHSRARSVHPRARSVHKRARGLHRRARSSRLRVQLLSRSAWNSLGCLSNVTKEAVRFPLRQTLNAVLTKTWPHDGKCGAAFGHRSSGTRLRENTNDLGAARPEGKISTVDLPIPGSPSKTTNGKSRKSLMRSGASWPLAKPLKMLTRCNRARRKRPSALDRSGASKLSQSSRTSLPSPQSAGADKSNCPARHQTLEASSKLTHKPTCALRDRWF